MVVRIRAELETGEVFVGPIMGNGDMMGSGALFIGYRDHAESVALGILHTSKDRASEGRSLSIFEPKRGYVAMYPDYCAETDGARVDVPLKGTTFSVELESGRTTASTPNRSNSPRSDGDLK